MISITQLKNILALKQKKIRTKEKLFLIEGYRLCQEALTSNFTISKLLICPQSLPIEQQNQIHTLASQKNIKPIEINSSHVKQLAETIHSQGVFCVVHYQTPSLEDILNNSKKIVILNAGQDPGNVGTIIRTCDWFGIDAVLLGTGTVEKYNSKVLRSTIGSIFHLPILEEIDLETTLPKFKDKNFTIFAADVYGQDYYHETDYNLPFALVIGNENKGIDQPLYKYIDKTIKIPSYGKAESLNMALATGIIISRMIN